MYYAVNLKDYEIWLINSKTLRLEEYVYYQVFDMMKRGIQIKNLVTGAYEWETGNPITMSNLELVCQFKGIMPRFEAGHTSTHYISKNNCIPVSLCNNCNPEDYIASTDSVIITKNKEFGLDIWNNGLLYTEVQYRYPESINSNVSIGLYLDENDVLTYCESYSDSMDYSYRTLYRSYEFSMFTRYGKLSECTRSQFLRSRLLE